MVQPDNTLTIPACEDFHCHLREGDMLKTVVPLLKKGGSARVLVMPNLIPPVTTVERALEYKKTLQEQCDRYLYITLTNHDFNLIYIYTLS